MSHTEKVIRGSAAILAALLIVLSTTRTKKTEYSWSGLRESVRYNSEPWIRVRLDAVGPPPWDIESTENVIVFRENGVGEMLAPENMPVHVDVVDGVTRISGEEYHGKTTLRTEGGSELRVGKRAYLGELVFGVSERPRPILHAEIESYVTQVLPGEMPLYYPPASLRAQAVAIRTYAISRMRHRKSAAWDVSDGESSQVLAGRPSDRKLADRYVQETSRIILLHDGDPFHTYFSSNCGGRTRSNAEAFGEAPLPPLQGTKCGHCSWARDHTWWASFPLERIRRSLSLEGVPRNAAITERASSGFESKISFTLEDGSRQTIPARRMKSALGHHRVKSTQLTGISVQENQLLIRGRGFGHGVGLCQNGARGMAELGRDARAILAHYYPGSKWGRLQW